MPVATIQRIHSITPHPNADALSVAKILGWQVVFNHAQNTYVEGDLVVYVEMDSVMPDKPEFEFLRKSNFRIKAITLRGVESAGIIFPLSILPLGKSTMTDDGNGNAIETQSEWEVGDDVTDILGIKHYEKPMPVSLAGEAYSNVLPGYLVMTDEKNLRSFPQTLDDLRGQEYYITRKDDGSSGTFFLKDGVFGVCSRRVHLKPNPNNLFWRLAEKYQIEQQLREYFNGQDVAIQGEAVGPSIQDNHLGLKEAELHIFNVWFMSERTYGTFYTVRDFCSTANIPMVTLLQMGDKFNYNLESLIAFANKQKYPNGTPAEGIVVRSQFPIRCPLLGGWWSGKIINENWKE